MSTPSKITLIHVDTLFMNGTDSDPDARMLGGYCDAFNEKHQEKPLIYLALEGLESKLAEMARDLQGDAQEELDAQVSGRLAFTWSWASVPGSGRLPEDWTAGNAAQPLG